MTSMAARHRSYAAASAPRAETPYTRARREWDNRLGTAVVQAKNWRINSLILAILLSVSLGGNVYLGRQPKVIPHIIEVDGLGEVHYRGPVGVSGSEFTPSEALVRYQLRRFIDLTRTISSDTVLLRKNWIEAYKMLSVSANTRMSEWVRMNNPFERMQSETTGIEILSAVPVSGESWQIDWRETTWDKQGQALGRPLVWRAMLKIVIAPPKTREQMLDNPLGLFVDELHWDRVQGVKP